ncbi:MAG: cytochrome C biogenesis protein [Bacillota bacterium]|nr:cytochrome C biogenesis protein [Bacillota bacterium]
MEFSLVKIETYIPKEYIEKLRLELNNIGALTVDGCYDYCMAISKVIGFWRPMEEAHPFIGEVGDICSAEEIKVEFCCKMELYKNVIYIIKKNHPYEKPVINVLPMISQ